MKPTRIPSRRLKVAFLAPAGIQGTIVLKAAMNVIKPGAADAPVFDNQPKPAA